MVKKDRKKLWIILIAIATFLLIVQPGGIMQTSTNVQNLLSKLTSGGATSADLGNPETDFLSIRLYDKDGKLIKSPGTFSTVTIEGVETKGVYYIDYTVMVDGTTSGTDISCTLSSVTPTPFAATSNCGPSSTPTISPGTLNLIAGSKRTWTSNRMSLPGTAGCNLESLSQPITITATVACTYFDGVSQVPAPGSPKVGTFVLTITAAGTAGYTVSVNTGGIPTEFCGDNICQSPLENSAKCPADCSPVGKAAFRTSDLSFVSGSAVAWNGQTVLTGCPTAPMTTYGYTGISCLGALGGGAVCPSTVPTGYTAKFSPLTTPTTMPSWASTKGCFYQKISPTTTVGLVFKQTAAGMGPCTNANEWGMVTYDSADSDASKVQSQATAFDFAKELACTS